MRCRSNNSVCNVSSGISRLGYIIVTLTRNCPLPAPTPMITILFEVILVSQSVIGLYARRRVINQIQLVPWIKGAGAVEVSRRPPLALPLRTISPHIPISGPPKTGIVAK